MSECPLKILLTTDVAGGVWDFCLVLGQALTQRGHQIDLIAFGEPSNEQREAATRSGVRLSHANLKLEWMQDSQADVAASRRLIERVASQLRPDLVHANQYAFGDLDLECPIVLTAHSDVLSWVTWVERQGTAGPVPPAWQAYWHLVRAGLNGAAAVTTVSGFQARELVSHYRPNIRPIVIPNGWPTVDETDTAWQSRPARSVLGGRVWDRAKNVATAVEAARTGGLGEVLLVGEQRHPEHGQASVFPTAVRALGALSREHLDRLLRSSRVFVAASRYEPFGLLPLQAALHGCALLLSDIPSFRELWSDSALYFFPDDALGLRRHWQRLLTNESFATSLAERSRRQAQTLYGIDRVAKSYLNVYRSLLQAPSEPLTASWITA